MSEQTTIFQNPEWKTGIKIAIPVIVIIGVFGLYINSQPEKVEKIPEITLQEKVLKYKVEDDLAQQKLTEATEWACNVRVAYGKAKLELAGATELRHENDPLPPYCLSLPTKEDPKKDFQQVQATPKTAGILPVAKAKVIDFSAGESAKLHHTILFTSYNPEKGQTDGSPCIGASGIDQCDGAKRGERYIALSQDLVGRAAHKKFKYGMKVVLKSTEEKTKNDPRCNGEYIVVDTMNKRFKNRGDIFQMSRKNNVLCRSEIWSV